MMDMPINAGDAALGASDAVVCRNIAKDFPAGSGVQRVLHGIDLAIKAGELTMLIGPSGCGKTTLISIMAGTLTPTEGEVELYGRAIARGPLR